MCRRLVVCGIGEPNAISNAIGYAKFCSRSHNAVIRVYDEAGIVIEPHSTVGEFKSRNAPVAVPKRFHFLNAK
jgi:hypothetical protein